MTRELARMFPESPKSSSGLVWHYTSPEGLAGVLQNDVLWATSAAFLNDTHEFTSGIRQLRRQLRSLMNDPAANESIDRHIDELKVDPSGAFILSGSRDGDSLTLWRNYGKHSVGYAIGLRPDVPLTPLQIGDGQTHPQPPPGWEREMMETPHGPQLAFDPDRPEITPLTHKNSHWVRVVYGGGARRKILRKEAWAFLKSEPKDAGISLPWLNALLRIKDSGFKDESEVRIGYTSVKPDWRFVAFRSTQWGLTPYIQLTTAPPNYQISDAAWGMARAAKTKAKLPISHIRIGPTPYRSAARKALRQMLDLNGYSQVKILSSKTPYRG